MLVNIKDDTTSYRVVFYRDDVEINVVTEVDYQLVIAVIKKALENSAFFRTGISFSPEISGEVDRSNGDLVISRLCPLPKDIEEIFWKEFA